MSQQNQTENAATEAHVEDSPRRQRTYQTTSQQT